MGASMRNSLHRRNHKERGQLAHRSRLGLLEKHKDYVQRARDYSAKKTTIHRLALKVEARNKDEFYFGMVKGKTKGGVHVTDRGNTALPVDVVKVLKSQDANYIRTMRAAGLKKIASLKSQLTSLADLIQGDDAGDSIETLQEDEIQILEDAGIIPKRSSNKGGTIGAGKHVLFAENEEQAQALLTSSLSKISPSTLQSPPISMEEDEPLDLGWILPPQPPHYRERLEKQRKKAIATRATATAEREKLAKQHRAELHKELSARLRRDTLLLYTLQELENQKATMGKGAARMIRDKEQVGRDDEDKEEEEQKRIFDKKKGKWAKPRTMSKEEEKLWKPRVWKWKAERKR